MPTPTFDTLWNSPARRWVLAAPKNSSFERLVFFYRPYSKHRIWLFNRATKKGGSVPWTLKFVETKTEEGVMVELMPGRKS